MAMLEHLAARSYHASTLPPAAATMVRRASAQLVVRAGALTAAPMERA